MILRRVKIHLVDMGVAWTTSNLFDYLIDRCNVALKHKFHPSVGKVARVSAKPMHPGTATYKITKTNALHSTSRSSLNTVHLALP